MRLPDTTSYEDWDAMRRKRFAENKGTKEEFGYPDVTVQHNEYETCLFMGDHGNSGIATWVCATGYCYIMTKRQAIFRILEGMRNYMMNALDAWEFEELGDHNPEFEGQTKRNIDIDLAWGVLFSNDDLKAGNTEENNDETN